MKTIVAFLALGGISWNLLAQPCNPAASEVDLDINNVRATLLSGGDMWWDLNSPGYEVPQGSGTHSIFAGSLWLGGMDQGGQIHMAAQTYRQTGNDFWPGPLTLNATTDATTCNEYDRHWKVNHSVIVQHINAYNSMGAPIPLHTIDNSILEWPAKGNPYAQGSQGMSLTINQPLAPFVDMDGDGNYDPTQGDYPEICGDQHIFWVFNDKGDAHTETGGQSLGIEVRANAYAFGTSDVMNNTTFYRYEIIYKNNITLNDVYLGLWMDVDIGCFNNDYIGCDPGRDMAIAYNGTATDPDCSIKGYGNDPPLLGVKILKGPINDNFTDNLGMSSFMTYNNDFSGRGNPESAGHFYNYMKAIWKDNTALTQGGSGYGGTIPASFIYPGNPASGSEWSECSASNVPGDRRLLMGIGPFTLSPGSVNTIDFAVIWTRPSGFFCDDFDNSIGLAADQVQAFFDTMACGGLSVSVDEINIKNEVLGIYPNPVKDKFNISGLIPGEDYVLNVFDIWGRKVLNSELKNEFRDISINGLESGVYFYGIQHKNLSSSSSGSKSMSGRLVVK